MEKIINENNESKTTQSCLLINTSEDYTWLLFLGIALLITSIIECFLCLLSVSCFVLIPVMHKNKRNKIKKEIEKNKNSYTYKIDGNIYELEMASQKEYYELKSKNYNFTILCNRFSIDRNGTAFVIRDHSTISNPDAKTYIDKNVSETIRIYYDQITDITTGKILHSAELKQFLYEEETK